MFASCLGLNVPLEMASLIMFLTQHLPHNTAIFLTLLITSLFGLFFVFFFSFCLHYYEFVFHLLCCPKEAWGRRCSQGCSPTSFPGLCAAQCQLCLLSVSPVCVFHCLCNKFALCHHCDRILEMTHKKESCLLYIASYFWRPRFKAILCLL